MTATLRVPCVLRALCALWGLYLVGRTPLWAVQATATNETHCKSLQRNLGSGLGSTPVPARSLSEGGEERVLRLAGSGGGAARAAQALLRALLVHALHYDERVVLTDDNTTLQDLQLIDDDKCKDQFILSVASAWQGNSTTLQQCASGSCGVAGKRLVVLGAGAAPAARRLHARLGPAVDADCTSDWAALRRPSCGFLYTNIRTGIAERSDWMNDTPCSPSGKCLTVVVNADEDEALALEHRRRAGALLPPLELRFVPLSDAELRAKLQNSTQSFLFFDYDMWADDAEERVWPAPPLPRPPHVAPWESAVSLLVADARKLVRYAPPVMQLALQFRPPPALLRRILTKMEALTLDEAACETANFYENDIRGWLDCDDACDPKPEFYVYVCDWNFSYYVEILKETISYWTTTLKKSVIMDFVFVNTTCSDTNDVLDDFKAQLVWFESGSKIQGLIAMGAAAASSSLRSAAANVSVPLLLVTAPPADESPGAARSTAAALPQLAAAARALLTRCGWRRVALLREEGRCDKWKRSMGLGGALRAPGEAALLLHEQVLTEDSEQAALAALGALRAVRARVVLVDASARTAARVLRAAQARGLAPHNGYAWIVLGAASDVIDTDWRPSAQFSYVSVSSSWRGGSPAGPGSLRARLDARLRGSWTPHAAPLADALLLALEGTTRLHKRYPQYRYDLRWKRADRTFFELLDNVTVEGVTHGMRGNSSPPVFFHLWGADGARLVGVWSASGDDVDADACGAVRDAPVCRTTQSGALFAPYCHDFAWAIAACVLALGPPALCAARAARRQRLARRDRAVEERALLRGGHTAAEAAAGAALAEHAVPSSALRLIDELGTGHYGVVRLAVMNTPGGEALAVAAKAPRADAPPGAAAELLREAALLATLRHEHVVRFTGVCWEGGPLMLMEHAFHGDLRRYLRRRRPAAERARAGLPEPAAADVAAGALTRLAREAAAALGYLADRRLVHRDVRAANCLVDARHSLKLGDFGMARWLGEGEYACKRRAMFPVLWMAPESLTCGVSSTASDVWALGVLLLELATLGERPYGTWSTGRVLRHVRNGGAPPLPHDAASATRGVVAACWRRIPKERPSAAELVAYLAEHPHAVQPALGPPPEAADADGLAPSSPDSGHYIDEWTV